MRMVLLGWLGCGSTTATAKQSQKIPIVVVAGATVGAAVVGVGVVGVVVVVGAPVVVVGAVVVVVGATVVVVVVVVVGTNDSKKKAAPLLYVGYR